MELIFKMIKKHIQGYENMILCRPWSKEERHQIVIRLFVGKKGEKKNKETYLI